MNALLFIVIVLLFVALTPGVLVSLPPKASKLTVSFTHGLIFAIVWTLIHKPIWRFGESISRGMKMEGMTSVDAPKDGSMGGKCLPNNVCTVGKCKDNTCQ